MNKLTKLLAAVQRHAAPLLTAYIALVLALTHVPLPPATEVVTFESDKLEHFLAYGVMSLLASIWLHRDQPRLRARRTAAVLLLVLTIGALDEITQPLAPFHRVCDPRDWAADLLGALTGAALYVWTRRRGLFGDGAGSAISS